MMEPLPLVGAILPPASHWAWAVFAAVTGAVAGRLLGGFVGGLLDRGVFADVADSGDAPPPPAGPARAASAGRRWMAVAAAAACVGLWWWEVRSLGLHAESGAGPGPQAGELVARWAAHALLFAFLAAATWIDLRHRVIPDGVTLPGVLLGLVTLWTRPDVLLPVACEVERPFGPPLPVPDVLGWHGPLRSGGGPEWMGAAPHPAGLLVSLAIFLAWWSVCTAPWLDPAEATDRPGGRWRRVDPRTLVLIAGLGGIAAAWWLGGLRFQGLESALVGVAVAAGLVWCVREGASRALGREAMGLGDVTLMAMVGAWVGWQAAVVAFFLAAFLGLAHGLVQVVRHRESELPYGPSLCLASVLVIVGWRWLWPVVAGAFADPLLLAAVLGAVVVLTAVTLAIWRWLRG